MNESHSQPLTILLDRFDAAWESGELPRIEAFMEQRAASVDARLLLIELIMIDLERRWSSGGSLDVGPSFPRRPLLDDYVAEFPQLSPIESVPRQLVVEEFRVRWRWGDRPDVEEFAFRFPHLEPELSDQLRGLLADQSFISNHSNADTDATNAFERETVDLGAPPTAVEADSAATTTVGQTFGDYEILGEIARGGMGVVYRARQSKANRIVALKMILAGNLADDESVQRFYSEAKAAAHLDHPGIVPVYDVGECDGAHYFTMAFVEGRSLQEILRSGPVPSKAAASLLVKIADAVSYAHGKGVIHRDLKPANILLDKEGVPKVADFGLAKQVSNESNLTLTGQVMGTPSYMPPEQALGKSEQIGPAADVYALGAMLYEMLCGRPPFRAATLAETLQQVIHDDPVTPRSLNSGIDRDMETVCLRCLEKEPSGRYESAEALAAELRRYIRSEPILARPLSRPARLWRWCKRNQTLAVSLAMVSVVVVASLIFSGYVLVRSYRDVVKARRESVEDRMETMGRVLEMDQPLLEETSELRRQLIDESRKTRRVERALEQLAQLVAAATLADGSTGVESLLGDFQALPGSELSSATLPRAMILDKVGQIYFAEQEYALATDLLENSLLAYIDSNEMDISRACLVFELLIQSADQAGDTARVQLWTDRFDNLFSAWKRRPQIISLSELDAAAKGTLWQSPQWAASLAVAYDQAGQYQKAHALRGEALKTLDEAETHVARELAQRAALHAVESAMLRGDLEEFQRLLTEVSAGLNTKNWRAAQLRSLRGAAELSQSNFDAAEPLLTEGYESLQQKLKYIPLTEQRYVREAGERVVALYQSWGKVEEAERWRQRVTAEVQRRDLAHGKRSTPNRDSP